MQQLEKKNTYTPLNTSPVQCNFDPLLNKEETLSVTDLKISSNTSEENLQSGKTEHNLRVYVLNMRKEPLMPCTPGKARHLLEAGKAKIIQRTPFTIQLLYATGESKQSITLGIDPGYSYIGFSAVTDTTELISGELTLRNDIKRLLEQRASYRRTRRSRLWHREPRFNNRSKPIGWLPPSIQHKLDSHLNLIDKIKALLPITSTIIEIATFDQQRIQNPEISGIEYQQGTLQGYNIREYLLEKFNHKCAYCNKSNIPLEIEHIIPKSRGGSNRVSNLTIACHVCNQSKNNLTAAEFGHPSIQAQAKKPLRSTAFMNTIKKRLFETLIITSSSTSYTYGYITKRNRILLNIPKSHYNDAFIIATGTTQHRIKPYTLTQIRRNNRSIQTNRKGYKPSIRKQRYSFQPNDLVKHNNLLLRVKGVFNYGKWIRLVDSVGNIINTNIKKVELITYGKGIQFR